MLHFSRFFFSLRARFLEIKTHLLLKHCITLVIVNLKKKKNVGDRRGMKNFYLRFSSRWFFLVNFGTVNFIAQINVIFYSHLIGTTLFIFNSSDNVFFWRHDRFVGRNGWWKPSSGGRWFFKRGLSRRRIRSRVKTYFAGFNVSVNFPSSIRLHVDTGCANLWSHTSCFSGCSNLKNN